MAENVSLIINFSLVSGIVIALLCLLRARRQTRTSAVNSKPSLGTADVKACDEIIAVRKIVMNESLEAEKPPKKKTGRPQASLAPVKTVESSKVLKAGKSLMVLLSAKEDRQLAGYELLQTLLACGLRFGEGNLFHRHEQPNGQGNILCSLAAATSSGMFDLQNIGAFSVKGLCLFMQVSGNALVDQARLDCLFKTASQLAEGLDTHLLTDQKQRFTEETLSRYHRLLNLTAAEV